MELQIKNRIITSSIIDIINKLRESAPRDCFKDILMKNYSDNSPNVVVTCPNIEHSEGKEKHPSCSIFNRRDDPKIPYGWVHCFSCGYSKSLPAMIGDLFEEDVHYGEQWLLQNAESSYIETLDYIPEIKIEDSTTVLKNTKGIDESILMNYNYYHPYMQVRKLSKEVVDKFQIGYDPGSECITFPVRDIFGKLVMVTKRSVKGKYFFIPSKVEKPLYLLDDIIKNNYKIAMITEAQIDALTAYTYGFPCCATMGEISDTQISILNSCGITNFIAAFDNDEAGKRFTSILREKLNIDILITELNIPEGFKDINDLDRNTFDKLLNNLGITWRIS